MRVGLVGFSGSGKSTLFQLLTGAKPDPGKVHSGQLAATDLPDPRLDVLREIYKPKNNKVTYTSVSLIDTPGLIPGTHGDNPQRLAVIREADALMIVLDHHSGADPVADLRAFREEMVYADLGVLTNRSERLEAGVKKHRPDWEQLQKEWDTVKRAVAVLEQGGVVADLDLTLEEKKPMRSFGLLTDKTQMILVNGPADATLPESLAADAGTATLRRIDAKLEWELLQMPPDERAVFMEELGVAELQRDPLLRLAYATAGMHTFFTAGDPEVRSWGLEQGGNSVDAAGKIHTDLARGFIRAEVLAFDDLQRAGSVKDAKAQNHVRLEGKEYVVRDGDIIYFRSST